MTHYIILAMSLTNRFLKFILLLIVLFSCFLGKCSSYKLRNGVTLSTYPYSVKLKPYQWHYIRVDLPRSFSSVTISLESNVDLNLQKLEKIKRSSLTVICIRDRGPPLPDDNYDITRKVFEPLSNASFGNTVLGLHEEQLCYPSPKSLTLKLTNAQILPGVWYFGFFNGIGPTRTQAKMIERGRVYSLNANISIEKCHAPNLGGPYCDQKIHLLSCADKKIPTKEQNDSILTQKLESSTICNDTEVIKCLTDREQKIYALYVNEITEQLQLEVKHIKFRGTKRFLRSSARYGAMPSKDLYDLSANISDGRMVIPSPQIGWWYFSISLGNHINKDNRVRDENKTRVCFSLDWKVSTCPQGKTGLNCASNIYMIQRKLKSHTVEVLLNPLTPNGISKFSWTHFVFNFHPGDSGQNLLIQLKSNGSKIRYQLYAKHMGLSSLDNWDYYYANSTNNSKNSTLFRIYDSSEDVVSFYFLYVKEGTWTIGLRRLNHFESVIENQTRALISMEECPTYCANHGTCRSKYDSSGSLRYSYCSCDKDHGGFDCSVTIVSRLGHIWRSIFLVGSNAVALLPALWCLHQKAYADWIVFMLSGISSGIYHACDAGNPCLFSYDVLQFMDVWLSFMAIGSTLIYLTNLGEASKGAIRVGVAIITVPLVRNGSTKKFNIVIFIMIGALGLLLGLIIELCIMYFSSNFHVDLISWCQVVKTWIRDLIKTFTERFRWGILIAAFVSLAMAKFCWSFETPENYWIWHSLWHVSIYTSSFLFLFSKTIHIEGVLIQQDSTTS